MLRLWQLAALAAAFLAFTSFAADVPDNRGNIITIETPAERIVTLAPHLAELVFAAGAGNRLVGTVEWSDWPHAAREVPRIGDGFRIDMERLVALEPDLVLAWGGGTPQSTIENLRRLGLPVAVLVPEDLESIPRHIEWIGEVTDNAAAASRQADDFREHLVELRERFGHRRNLPVFYQINDPLVFTVGGDHTITEAIETCGGSNIFGDLPAGAHSVSREEVLSRNPEVILIGSHREELYDSARWDRWSRLKAVQSDNVMQVEAALLARPAPRILEGVQQVCERLEQARERLAGQS